jgi:uncharacterized protein (TIGR03000 family)
LRHCRKHRLARLLHRRCCCWNCGCYGGPNCCCGGDGCGFGGWGGYGGYGYGGFGSGSYGYAGYPYGGYGGYGSYGYAGYGGHGYGGLGPVGAATAALPPLAGAGNPTSEDESGVRPVSLASRDGSSQAARASLVVALPAGARLFIDDRPITTGRESTFRTPKLEPGEEYYYQVRVEVERNGRTVQESRKLVFRAGDEVRASFLSLGR